MKTCSNKNCSQLNPQPLTSYYKSASSKDGLKHQCKVCLRRYNVKRYYKDMNKRRALSREWKKNNPDKVKDLALKNKYGISLSDYQVKLHAQNECCAICFVHKDQNIVDKRTESVRDLAVDHNHKTLKVRGLLCYHCNLAVGMIKDNIEIAQKLVEYLKLYEKES